MPVPAFIGLGANLGNPAATLTAAIAALSALPDTRVSAVSGFYQSAPIGPADQPDYVNAVACLATGLSPHALLAALQDIENQHGRTREVRWGARTLDLDLLLYGNDEISTSSLIVPHIELKNRNFVVIPLLDICPELQLPDGTRISSLPVASHSAGLTRLSTDLPLPIDDQ
jgi:2-amino-4-hydroxy-6-hydroxymethyldihydropteridine diphosphokinase